MEKNQQLTIVGNVGGTSVELRQGAVISFGPERATVDIEICKGGLWLTAEGNPNDEVIRQGERHTFSGRHLVGQALTDSVIFLN